MADIASVMVPGRAHRAIHFTVKPADGSRLQVRGRGIYKIVMRLLTFVTENLWPMAYGGLKPSTGTDCNPHNTS